MVIVIFPGHFHLMLLLALDVTIELPLGAICYTALTNFSTKYLMMCKVYTDVGGIK